MISIYRLFGGIGLLLLGANYFVPLPHPFPWITGVCLCVGGVALLAGM